MPAFLHDMRLLSLWEEGGGPPLQRLSQHCSLSISLSPHSSPPSRALCLRAPSYRAAHTVCIRIAAGWPSVGTLPAVAIKEGRRHVGRADLKKHIARLLGRHACTAAYAAFVRLFTMLHLLLLSGHLHAVWGGNH